MNYKDLQNISHLTQGILIESAQEQHDVMNRWPYSSPYLQEDRAPGVKPYRANPTQAEVRADAAKAAKKKRESGKDKPGYGPEEKFKDWKDKATPSSTLKRKKAEGGTEPESVSQRMNREKPYVKRMTGQMAREYGSRHAAEVTRVVKGAGEPQSVTYPRMGKDEKKKPSREIVRRTKQDEEFKYWVNSLLDEGYDLSNYTWDEMAEMYISQSYNLYDIVLAHLIDEGYTDTIDGANAIMANMSEEWRESIMEAEGSYGQTPRTHSAYSTLARKGNKAASKHAARTDTRETPDERETRIRRTGMTKADRTYNRGAAEYGSSSYDPEEHDEPSGPGGMPRGKKLSRQRARGVSA